MSRGVLVLFVALASCASVPGFAQGEAPQTGSEKAEAQDADGSEKADAQEADGSEKAEPAPPQQPEQAKAAAPPPRPTLLLLPIRPAAGVEEDTTRILDDLAAVHMEHHKDHLDVTAYDDVKQVLDLQGEKHGLGCDEASCLAELAGSLGARYIVTGRLGKLGNNFILTMSLFDSDLADNVARGKASADDLGAIGDKLPGILDGLVGNLGVEAVDTARTARDDKDEGSRGDEEDAPRRVNDDGDDDARDRRRPLPPPDPEPNEGGVNWLAIGGGAAGICAGCAAMCGGTCFDVGNYCGQGCLPGAVGQNGNLELLDFIGPAICGVGLLPCAGGLAAWGFSYSPGDEPRPEDDKQSPRRRDDEEER